MIEILIECVYCQIKAPLDTMRILGREEGGMACKDIEACDKREAAQSDEEQD